MFCVVRFFPGASKLIKPISAVHKSYSPFVALKSVNISSAAMELKENKRFNDKFHAVKLFHECMAYRALNPTEDYSMCIARHDVSTKLH